MRYMTVADLKSLLEDYADDARVFILSQESWPFENQCAGICAREDFTDPEDTDAQAESQDDDEKKRPTDVFLCEGRQIRYGNKDAWQHARRR